jgi:hypothetical protein
LRVDTFFPHSFVPPSLPTNAAIVSRFAAATATLDIAVTGTTNATIATVATIAVTVDQRSGDDDAE